MRTTLLSFMFLAGVSLTASARFKIGGKTINTKKVVNAATDVAKAVTLSDADIVTMSREYIEWMDTHNEVAGSDTEMGQRLERLTKDIKVDGLNLNFKVYNVIDVNAFACGDGSVRVCGGLMEVMDDMAKSIADLEDRLEEVSGQVDEIDEDLADVEDAVFDDEDDDEDAECCECDDDDDCFGDDDDFYEVTCSNCGETTYITGEIVDRGEMECPNCGEKIEFDDIELDEDDSCGDCDGCPGCEGESDGE